MNLSDFDVSNCAPSLAKPETIVAFSVSIINRTPVCFSFNRLYARFDCLYCMGLETHGASVCVHLCVMQSLHLFKGEHTDAEQIRVPRQAGE